MNRQAKTWKPAKAGWLNQGDLSLFHLLAHRFIDGWTSKTKRQSCFFELPFAKKRRLKI